MLESIIYVYIGMMSGFGRIRWIVIFSRFRMMEWMRTGRELRQLADAFSRSKERDEVRKKAESVPLESLDADYFLQLLQELFQVGFIICKFMWSMSHHMLFIAV
jgi:hypothetical protein